MIANIALDDGLILPHSANPTGSNFGERQGRRDSNLCVSESDSLNFIADRGDLKRRWAPASRVSIAQHVNVPWHRAPPRHFGEFTKRVEHFLEHQKIATILMVHP